MSVFTELKRRNVLRMAAAYLAGAWLLTEVSETLFSIYGLPDSAARIVVTLLIIGFPVTLILSWVYQWTPEGLRLDTGIEPAGAAPPAGTRRLDRAIMVLLALALGYFAFDKFVLEPARVANIVEETAEQARSGALVESYGDRSIAVLPFVNMSADPEQEYFSDGISEELLNLLAQIPDLRVISRSSSFTFKGKDIAIPEVAKRLNVAHVLEGSVRKSGNRVRITAQLIDARADTHLWSQTYDRTLDDIFAVQDEIAAAISAALKMELALDAGGASPPTAVQAANSAAYDAYLRGRELINQRGRENTKSAARHLERALRLDENFAPAHAQLAIAMILYPGYTQEERQTAIAHLDRALELEPDLAEAHAGRAMLAIHDGDFESAVEQARKALDVNPNYIDAMRWLSMALFNLGHEEEAEALDEQVLVIDPLSVVGRVSYAMQLVSKGRTEAAHAIADQLLAENNLWGGYRVHINSYLMWEGRFVDALSWALRSSDIDFDVMAAFQFVGLFDEARRIDNPYSYWTDVEAGNWGAAIEKVLKKMQLEPDTPYLIADAAEVLFLAGRIDEALPLYKRLSDLVPEGQPIAADWLPLVQTMRLALARRKAGDEAGAQAAARIVDRELAAARDTGEVGWRLDLAEAMLAAFGHDPDRALVVLRSAIHHGLPTRVYIDDPLFGDLGDDPRFVALRQEMEEIFTEERDKVLQLICFHNPIPDEWQPLPETCEGVEQQSEL